MRKLVVSIIMLSALLLLVGCCPCRHLSSSDTKTGLDSTNTEYRERVIFVPDTVFVEIPKQTAERTTADSTSHLENDYALSDARINTDGSLFHTLATKPQAKPVPTEQQIVYRDSVVYKNRIVTQTKTEVREKAVPWYMKLIFWGSVGFNIFMLITYTIKIIRTHIAQITKKITIFASGNSKGG